MPTDPLSSLKSRRQTRSQKALVRLKTLASGGMISIFIWLGAGCVQSPFEAPRLVPLGGQTPARIQSRILRVTPRKFTVLNSIVFEKFGREITALGYTKVDYQADTISVNAFSPGGVKLFSFTETGGMITEKFVLDQFARLGDVAGAVALDIRRIYFDLFPAGEAVAQRKKYTYVFTTPGKTGVKWYVFGGENAHLLEKKFAGKNGESWRVRYYQYTEADGKELPGGVFFQNRQFGYRLTVRLKDIVAID